jgi:hypothetical protein
VRRFERVGCVWLKGFPPKLLDLRHFFRDRKEYLPHGVGKTRIAE